MKKSDKYCIVSIIIGTLSLISLAVLLIFDSACFMWLYVSLGAISAVFYAIAGQISDRE